MLAAIYLAQSTKASSHSSNMAPLPLTYKLSLGNCIFGITPAKAKIIIISKIMKRI
jgi:hypothetical protein